MKKISIIAFVVLLIITSLSLFACSADNDNDKLIIAVSIVPEETFVKAVCKDKVEVVTMIPSGSNPENYEPSAKEIMKFSDAKLYFSIGVPTEEANIIPKVSTNTKTISLQNVVSQKYEERTFESGERDPHIWLSPKRVKVIIESIRDEITNIDPQNADFYAQNARDYLASLDTLNLTIEHALDGVKNREFICYHPAFGYLAKDYDLTMYALEEEGKEATPQHLTEMIDFAKKEGIKVIFYQASVDSSQSASFAEQIGGQAIQLDPLAANYIENLTHMANKMAETMS